MDPAFLSTHGWAGPAAMLGDGGPVKGEPSDILPWRLVDET
jgi:hypothetical protein